jgi:uncharacterized protein (TIGR02246 family)
MARSTLQLVHDRMDASSRGDLEAEMAFFADDAVQINQSHIHIGKKAIRASAERFHANFRNFKGEVMIEQVHDNVALVVWRGDSDAMRILVCVETLIFRDEKVSQWTWWWALVPK